MFLITILLTTSTEEFLRAVMVCTGFSLGSHIVNTVFNIFDKDGDGHLSHKEFISLMKDRLHRGARVSRLHRGARVSTDYTEEQG